MVQSSSGVPLLRLFRPPLESRTAETLPDLGAGQPSSLGPVAKERGRGSEGIHDEDCKAHRRLVPKGQKAD
eukprot:4674329-Lingulodinium_polyedra.AAC.1